MSEHHRYRRRTPPKSAYVNLGGGIRLLSTDYFAREFEPLGLSKQSFHKLCRNIGCPLIRIGRTWTVNLSTFQSCMQGISRVGQPDFLFPGCDMVRKDCTKTLDPAYYEENWRIIMAELLASRKLAGLPTPREVQAMARAAAETLVSVGLPDAAAEVKRLDTAKALRDMKRATSLGGQHG